jgi:nucleotide-binding universal stress UspA family protein
MNEMMKILIAYDGSDSADNAIEELVRAGLPRKAKTTLFFVRERWLALPVSEKLKAKEKSVVFSQNAAVRMARTGEEMELVLNPDQRKKLTEAKQRLNVCFPEWEIKTFILKGSPSREIIQHARKTNTDLIVIGCQGKTKSKTYLFGSVSQKIANEASCSVRIVRGRVWKQSSPNRILIGFDGTELAGKAVTEVANRMWLPGSEVRLVMARDNPENYTEFEREHNQQIDLLIQKYIADARKKLENTELIVSELVEVGDPKQIIINAADEWGADCIFIGANNGLNYFENLLLGSVSTAVVVRSHCTVEIVR